MARPSSLIPTHDPQRAIQLVEARPGNVKAPALYGFYIFDIGSGRVVRSFGFDIPPQMMELDEQAAAEAAAAQEGGVFSDERGQYFKMVSMSGTFGFRPTPRRETAGLVGLSQAANQIQNAVNDLRGKRSNRRIPQGEVTGTDRYIALHNLIRFYWDSKMVPEVAGRFIFVYANWRFGEVYVVQPLRFKRSRQAPSDRVKVKYNLTLKTLVPLEVSVRPKDFLPKPDKKTGLAFLQQKMRQSAQLLKSVSSFVKRGLNAGNQFIQSNVNTTLGLANSVVESILDPIDAAVELVEDVLGGAQNLATFPVNVLRDAHRSCMDMVGIADTLSALDPRKISQLYRNAATAIVDLFHGISLHNNRATAQEVANQFAKYHEPRDPNEESPFLLDNPLYDRGSNTTLGTRGIPEGREVITVPAQATIQQIAADRLGAGGRWRWLAVVNNLRAPYISPRGDGISVLRPGDPIVIPVPLESENDENQVWSPFPEVEQEDPDRYGRDIRLDLDSFDIEIVNGDWGLVDGNDNLIQATHIKTRRKPGDLIAHPWFGLSVEGGQSLEIDTRAQTYLEVQQMMSSDPRIERMDNLLVRIDGDILRVNGTLIPNRGKGGIAFASESKL